MEKWHAKSKIPQVLVLQYKLVGLYWHKVNEIVSDKYNIVYARLWEFMSHPMEIGELDQASMGKTSLC